MDVAHLRDFVSSGQESYHHARRANGNKKGVPCLSAHACRVSTYVSRTKTPERHEARQQLGRKNNSTTQPNAIRHSYLCTTLFHLFLPFAGCWLVGGYKSGYNKKRTQPCPLLALLASLITISVVCLPVCLSVCHESNPHITALIAIISVSLGR
ncbi:hypothetical protein M426DRAFT_133905 [Hypoxylon sp. CI-4A]|nr:hypothetical protein M426DRAFT_133905 [Hypoxylon sp. CI-4A]